MTGTWWVRPEQLNTEQMAVIDLDPQEDHVIFGPPGSGKTNLLLLRANYLYLGDQKNIEVVVFTRTLHRFLAAGGQQYAFPDDKVVTLKRWQRRLLREYDVPLPQDGHFDRERELIADAIEELIERRGLSGLVECFLLDEAHDYTPREMKILRRLGKRIFAVADGHQKIYGTPDSLAELTHNVDSIHTLRHHYRIGRTICVAADHLARDADGYVPMLPTCNYDEVAMRSSVDLVPCDTQQMQIQQTIDTIRLQLEAYPGEMIGVLCPRRDAVQAVWNEIANSDIAHVALLQLDDEHPYFDADTRVCVSTIHSAKGLEYRAVHILTLEQLTSLGGGHHRNIAFTAFTRAKTSLTGYYTGYVPGFIEQAVSAVHPLTASPAVSDAFGRRDKKGSL